MKYKGQKLVEVTEPQIFNPPKEMVAWVTSDETIAIPTIEKVCAILPYADRARVLIAKNGGYAFAHGCAEIPAEPKPRIVTNRELAEWLAKGNGEYADRSYKEWHCRYHYDYLLKEADREVAYNIAVRKWDDKEWHEPTIDYMGIDE